MKQLHYFNLIGVLAVTALCVGQWHFNRQLNLEVNRLEQIRLEHEEKIAGQSQSLQGLSADLENFRGQLVRSTSESAETRQKLIASERLIKQLEHERAQLKESVTNWPAAVTGRDQRIKEANERLRQQGEDLSNSIRKFNELAGRHNKLVKDWNELQAKQTTTTNQPPPVSSKR